MKKSFMRGVKAPKRNQWLDRVDVRRPVQLDLFPSEMWWYHEGRLLYVPKKGDE